MRQLAQQILLFIKLKPCKREVKTPTAAISEVVAIIDQVARFSTTIATAVIEQTETSQRISGTISQAARGSDEITQAITEIASTVKASSVRASHVQKQAQELASLGEQLRQLVDLAKVAHTQEN